MKPLAALAALLLWWLAASAPALAVFDDHGSSARHSISSNQLAPPTNPSTSAGLCTPAVTDRIVVHWTATSSAWADGYEILRSRTAGGPYTLVGTVSGAASNSYTDANVTWSTTYRYVVRAVKHTWTSATTTEVQRTTRTLLCV